MIMTHILGYFRMQGLSSMTGYLPIGDANAITLELIERSLLNVIEDCPVIAGILCADPTRDMHRCVDRLAAVG
jgi:predicted TIM-barrel enzyme